LSNRAGFEQAIARAPDDPAPYAVYADWLIAQGDPLGELITLSLTGNEEGAAALIPQVLGKEAWLLEEATIGWRFGLARSVRVRNDGDSLHFATDVLRAHPCGFLLDELHLDFYEAQSLEAANLALAEIAAEAPLPWLRRFVINARPSNSYTLDPVEDARLSLASVPGLAPDVRELVVHCHHLGDDLPALPSLRRLELCPDVLMSSSVPNLAMFPQLEELALNVGRFQVAEPSRRYTHVTYDVFARARARNSHAAQASHLARLAERPHPALHTLRLWHVPDADALLALLATSELLPQLRVLDLRPLPITETLPPAFAHLELELGTDVNASRYSVSVE
jgi:uncharacterized protein (TIGR02996 family)